MVPVGGPNHHSSRSDETPQRAQYFISLATRFDLQAMEESAALGQSPRHFLHRVQQKLSANLYNPGDVTPSLLDRLGGRLLSTPDQWAVARSLTREAHDGDVIFAHDNDGLVIALMALFRRKRLGILLSTMSPERGRFRLATGRLRLGRRIGRFLVNTEDKATTLHSLGIDRDRIWVGREQTDTEFFTPGPPSSAKSRPMIFSAGREQRDYATLAAATADLDVDVRICAASPNATTQTSVAYPDPVPANMSFGPYPWPDFVQAYRDADIVVVPLLPHTYSAGLTVAMEAMACARPVVATNVPGGMADLIAAGIVTGCEPSNPSSLRAAIVELLEHPERGAEQARRGYERVMAEHRSDQLVDDVVNEMQALADT